MSLFDNSDFFQSDVLQEMPSEPVPESRAKRNHATSSARGEKAVRNRHANLTDSRVTSAPKLGLAQATVFGLTLLIAPLSAITSSAERVDLSMHVADASGFGGTAKETSDWVKGVMERTAREGPARVVNPKDFMAAIRKLRGSIRTA